MSAEPATVSSFSNAVVLVCRDCRERGQGPKKLKAPDIVKALKQVLRLERPRSRVLTSSCLGLCPKRATAVARVGSGDASIAAVAKLRQIDAWVPLINPPSRPLV